MVKTPLSDIRKRYITRLVGRCFILLFAIALYITGFEKHDVLQGFAFFERITWMHVLWVIWMLDMLFQLIPVKNVALGSHKVFKLRFRPASRPFTKEALKAHIIATTKSAYKVMVVWIALIAVGQRAVLCMRSDLCIGVVSFPLNDGKPLLHHLPHFQLGSFHDVHPYGICKRFLLPFLAGGGCGDSGDLGVVCGPLSGALLGKVQCCAEML